MEGLECALHTFGGTGLAIPGCVVVYASPAEGVDDGGLFGLGRHCSLVRRVCCFRDQEIC